MSWGSRWLKKPEAKRNKFNASHKLVDGIEFDSAHEAERYMMLKDDQRMGLVRDLKIHQPLQVEVNGFHVFTYTPDFVYERKYDDNWVKLWEDAKGYRKGEVYKHFRTRKAVIKAALGIEIIEV